MTQTHSIVCFVKFVKFVVARWVYAVTAAVATGTTVRIGVTATDRPGGTAAAEESTTV